MFYPFLFFTWAFVLCGCTNSVNSVGPAKSFSHQNPHILYNAGKSCVEKGRYRESFPYFKAISYDNGTFDKNPHAQILYAYSAYKDGDTILSLFLLDRFYRFYPQHPLAPYGLYLKGLCCLQEVDDLDYDQSSISKALNAFSFLCSAFPQSSYSQEATKKIALLQEHQTEKEMAVGRFYLLNGYYLAALKRFLPLMAFFEEQKIPSRYTPEVLLRLTECFYGLRLVKEAEKYGARLQKYFPHSIFSQEAITLKNKLFAPKPK